MSIEFSITRKIKETGFCDIHDLKVGDEISLTDLAGEAVFKVVHISRKYVYFMRKYVLPTDMRRPVNERNTNEGGFKASDLYDWLNTTYLASLPEVTQEECDHKIFLPKEVNIFGEHIYSDAAEKGKQWDYFKKPKNRMRVYQDTLNPASWWEVSAYVSNATYFCFVLTDGSANNYYASNSCGLVPCFRIKLSKAD